MNSLSMRREGDSTIHTDELIAEGKTHLRIDRKVSGIGSNSSGPELEKEYRLAGKDISFQFSIRPIHWRM